MIAIEWTAVLVAAVAAVGSGAAAWISRGSRRKTDELASQLQPPNGVRIGLMIAEIWQALASHVADDGAHAGRRMTRLPPRMAAAVEQERAERKRREDW